MDYSFLRRKMVDEQLKPRDITDKDVLAVFYKLERERFAPQELRDSAYEDHPLAIGEGQTISQPYIAALMTERLGFSGTEKALEVGTGSGYQTAILAELAKEVFSIERIRVLADKARTLLEELKYTNISIRIGDGTLGWQEESPFDRIIVTAAGPSVPLPLVEQLKEGGKMVLPLGDPFSQMLTLVTKNQGRLEYADICPCVFVPLK